MSIEVTTTTPRVGVSTSGGTVSIDLTQTTVSVGAVTSNYPTAHAASHASGGGDPVTIAQSQVTDLTSDLAGKSDIGSTFRPVIRTNAYLQPPVYTGANIGSFTMVEGRQYFIPINIPKAISIDRLAVSVSTQGGSGSVVRLGFYANDTGATDGPTTLLADAGTIDSTTTGDKTATVSPTLAVPAGMYWLSACLQGGSGTAAVLVGGFNWISGWNQQVFTSGASGLIGLYAAGITGAFASNPTIVSFLTSGPRVGARVA